MVAVLAGVLGGYRVCGVGAGYVACHHGLIGIESSLALLDALVELEIVGGEAGGAVEVSGAGGTSEDSAQVGFQIYLRD